MNFLTLAVGTYFPITVSSSESGDRCAIHRAGHREFGLVMRRFWKMQKAEPTSSFDFPQPGTTPFLDMQALRDFIRTKLLARAKNKG